MKDRDPDQDHLYFFELYPYGQGGMYDHRPYGHVNASMYVRWMLYHILPFARRNKQFLFSCVHNKEIRAAHSGIYAALHSSHNPNVAQIKEEIRTNNRVLESKLSTTLGAIRGSKEYWTSVLSDLIAFDETYATATWFFTLAFSEFNDPNLHQYLISKNQDFPDVEKIPFSN